jgi:hypothetical protein
VSSADKHASSIRSGLVPTTVSAISPAMSVLPSCFVAPMPPAAVELLTAIAPVLSRWGRWYVFGAQAVTAHGVPRLSADVDITIALQPEDPVRFTADMTNAGFTSRFPDPSFARATRVLPFVHVASGVPVDHGRLRTRGRVHGRARARPLAR